MYIAGLHGRGRRDADGIVAEVGQVGLARRLPAIGVGIGTHPSVTLGRQLGQLRQ